MSRATDKAIAAAMRPPAELLDETMEQARLHIEQLEKVQRLLDAMSTPPTEAAGQLQLTETLTCLAAISTLMKDAAKRLAVQGVLEGAVTRVEVGELLGVHENTVGRWVNAVRAAATDAETGDEQ